MPAGQVFSRDPGMVVSTAPSSMFQFQHLPGILPLQYFFLLPSIYPFLPHHLLPIIWLLPASCNYVTSDCATGFRLPVNIRVPNLCFQLRSPTPDVRRLLAYRTPSLSTSTAFSGVFLLTGPSHPASSRVLYQVSSNTFSPFRDFLPSGFYFVTGFSHLFIFPRLKVFSFQ